MSSTLPSTAVRCRSARSRYPAVLVVSVEGLLCKIKTVSRCGRVCRCAWVVVDSAIARSKVCCFARSKNSAEVFVSLLSRIHPYQCVSFQQRIYPYQSNKPHYKYVASLTSSALTIYPAHYPPYCAYQHVKPPRRVLVIRTSSSQPYVFRLGFKIIRCLV